jgi:hypothetical protein
MKMRPWIVLTLPAIANCQDGGLRQAPSTPQAARERGLSEAQSPARAEHRGSIDRVVAGASAIPFAIADARSPG